MTLSYYVCYYLFLNLQENMNQKYFDTQNQRLSPRLDNFYQKIGVKTLGLLYPIVCRLQVPKWTSSSVRQLNKCAQNGGHYR